MRIRSTHAHSRGARYRRTGGPWTDDTLPGLFGDGPRAAYIDGATEISASGARDMASRVAAGLRAEGVRRGDAVAWQLPNSIESVLLYRACWQLGAVAVPIHHRAPTAERNARVQDVGAAVAVTEPGGIERWFACEPHPLAHARPSDPAVVLFTAGSTGDPKGVIHTHRSLACKARQMVDVHGLRPDDAVLMPAPLAHVSGLLNGILVPGVAGIPSVLQARWDPDEALDLIAAHSVSFMVGPPTFFVSMAGAQRFTAARVATLRLVSTGGAGVTPAFVEDASARFGARFKRTYGSTEAPTVATSTDNDPVERAARTDGRAFGDTELKLAGDGELLVRGPELFAGYLDARHNDAAFARGGWYRTGDLASLDADGWLTITGRKKDIIIRGGENISASAVEATLEAHPWVREAAAVGEPDDRLGERVVAFVVSDARFDLPACRRWFEEHGVARFATPEKVVRLDALPTLPAGKVDKAALRRSLGA